MEGCVYKIKIRRYTKKSKKLRQKSMFLPKCRNNIDFRIKKEEKIYKINKNKIYRIKK